MTHYDVLGVSKNATREEIRKAYKNLVKKYHPDLYGGDKSYADKKTKEINIAYDVLTDDESRKKYDEEIAKEAGTYSYTEPTQTDPYGARTIYEEVLRDYKNRYKDYFDNRNNASNSYGSYQSGKSSSKKKKKIYSYKKYEKINELCEEWDIGTSLKIGIFIGIILLLAVFIFLNSYVKTLKYSSNSSTEHHAVEPRTDQENQNENSVYDFDIYSKLVEESICVAYDRRVDYFGEENINSVRDLISEDNLSNIYDSYYYDVYSYGEFIEYLDDVIKNHIEEREKNSSKYNNKDYDTGYNTDENTEEDLNDR